MILTIRSKGLSHIDTPEREREVLSDSGYLFSAHRIAILHLDLKAKVRPVNNEGWAILIEKTKANLKMGTRGLFANGQEVQEASFQMAKKIHLHMAESRCRCRWRITDHLQMAKRLIYR